MKQAGLPDPPTRETLTDDQVFNAYKEYILCIQFFQLHTEKSALQVQTENWLQQKMVRLAGFEPATLGFGNQCSIH